MHEPEQYREQAAEFVDPTKPIEGYQEFNREGMQNARLAIEKTHAGQAVLIENKGKITIGVIRDFVYFPKGSRQAEHSVRIYDQISELKQEKNNLENLLLGNSLDESSRKDTKWRLDTVNRSLDSLSEIRLAGIYLNKYTPVQDPSGERKYQNGNPKDSYTAREFISEQELKESQLKVIEAFKTKHAKEGDFYADAQYNGNKTEPEDSYLKRE